MKKEAKRAMLTLIDIIKKPDLKILPGQLAFNFIFIIIPILTLFGFIASRIVVDFNISDYLATYLPNGITNLLQLLVIDNPNVNSLFFLVSILVLASTGFSSLVYASNALYGIKDKNMIKTRLKSLGMFFLIVFLLMFLILIPLFGSLILEIIIDVLNISTNTIVGIYVVYKVLEIILTFVIIFLCVDSIFIIAPNEKISNRTTMNGALFVAGGWMLSTYIYSFYITNLARYDQIYNNVSNIIMLLVWIFVLSYIFVMGLAINYKHYYNSKTLRTGDISGEENK